MSQPRASATWLEESDGRRWPVGSTCAIGRAASNDIVIADGKVSRRHALIHKQDSAEYWLIDLGSGNGTYVNGRRMTLSMRLDDADVLTFGERNFSFRQVATGRAHRAKSRRSALTVIEVKTTPCWLLLADIVGSTALASRLPSTELAILVGKWMAACKEIVDGNGGVINKYLGDGFFAYWPFEESQQTDLIRALEQLSAMQSAGQWPRFRLALHRGSVAVGGGGSLGEDSLTGLDIAFVFRMEKLASSLGCDFLVSEAVHAVLGSQLELEDAGTHELPGFGHASPPRFFSRR